MKTKKANKKKNSNIFIYVILFLIVIASAFLRFYKLTNVPPSITWDEAAVGYNAYTILHWGKDEWGNTLPLVFKSFRDYKNPVHVYLTAPFILIFGLTDLGIRSSAAFFGVLNVVVIFFLARKLFKSSNAGLFSSFFLAISPLSLQFSRFNHELQFAILFAMLGIWLFLKGLGEKKYLVWSFLFLGIDLLTYQSSKVVTFPLVVLLIILNIKTLWKVKKHFLAGLSIYFFFVSVLFIRPELLGTARLGQNKIPEEKILETNIYKITGNNFLGTSEVVLTRYSEYFGKKFLFISGDYNPRHSIQTVGTFYYFDLPFLIVGLFSLLVFIFYKKQKNLLILPAMLLLAPLPGAVSSTSPHVARAMFMLPSWILICSFGVSSLLSFIKNKYLIVISSVIVASAFYFPLSKYLKSYYQDYSKKYAIEWIYGMEDIIKFSQKYDFSRIYITNVRMQPYIFALFYDKTALPEYLESVKYDETKGSPSNLVSSFGKYRFLWDEIYSEPVDGVLYAVAPNVYDGLFRKNDFDVLKLIKYPDGTDAYYLITAGY